MKKQITTLGAMFAIAITTISTTFGYSTEQTLAIDSLNTQLAQTSYGQADINNAGASFSPEAQAMCLLVLLKVKGTDISKSGYSYHYPLFTDVSNGGSNWSQGMRQLRWTSSTGFTYIE